MLWGLMLGNFVDLDHVYYRIIGKAPWFGSACVEGLGSQCSFGIYPLHTWTLVWIGLIFGSLIFCCDKRLRFFGWLGVGVFLALFLDWVHLVSGFAF